MYLEMTATKNKNYVYIHEEIPETLVPIQFRTSCLLVHYLKT
jgi:hypothetical protein